MTGKRLTTLWKGEGLSTAGFQERLTDYVQAEQQSIYRLAYSYAGNEQDALDIVQSALVKALTARPMRQPQYLRTWVYRIVVNTALDWLRAGHREVSVDLDELDLAQADDPSTEPDLQRTLERLPPDLRTIVVLRFFEDLPLAEIAEITRLNLNTVKTRLYRGLELMRIQMEAEGHD